MRLPQPRDDQERSVLANIEEHGCHVWFIEEEPGLQPFAYSVGIQFTAGAPELVVYGLRPELTHFMINEYARRVRQGERFESGTDYEGFLGGHPVRFEPVLREHYREHFGWDRWLYAGDDFRVLQLVWPSTLGPFPCDAEADDDLRAFQPLLFACDCPDGHHPQPGDAAAGGDRSIVCPHVFDRSRPVLLVTHDEDGDWQLLCGGSDHGDDGHVTHLHHWVDLDPTLREVRDLAQGQQAERDAVGAPWRRGPRDDDEQD